ncbi:hypothetical protein [Streptomyces sp. VNUA24]|uniref:hypothetical protein n=1 Tax=Streptomyces sp. VNUA24 TaxID=3031131 RepID=UPI0023B808EC|nr:hypothetical protein [Streptomyces sp. VNUA24]WEH13158.1 hypothetical protein PYR72_05395 [Streptomyces sp. VNUA24]
MADGKDQSAEGTSWRWGQAVHDALPLYLQSELNRVGPPRRQYVPGELAYL